MTHYSRQHFFCEGTIKDQVTHFSAMCSRPKSGMDIDLESVHRVGSMVRISEGKTGRAGKNGGLPYFLAVIRTESTPENTLIGLSSSSHVGFVWKSPNCIRNGPHINPSAAQTAAGIAAVQADQAVSGMASDFNPRRARTETLLLKSRAVADAAASVASVAAAKRLSQNAEKQKSRKFARTDSSSALHEHDTDDESKWKISISLFRSVFAPGAR